MNKKFIKTTYKNDDITIILREKFLDDGSYYTEHCIIDPKTNVECFITEEEFDSIFSSDIRQKIENRMTEVQTFKSVKYYDNGLMIVKESKDTFEAKEFDTWLQEQEDE